jgi:hypothetical protein
MLSAERILSEIGEWLRLSEMNGGAGTGQLRLMSVLLHGSSLPACAQY